MRIAPPAADPIQLETKNWENEGGALKPPLVPANLPEGITAVPSMHYRLGPYTYLRLEDALAEHERQLKKGTRLP